MKIKKSILNKIIKEEISKSVGNKKIKMKLSELRSMMGIVLRESSEHLDYYIDLHNTDKFHTSDPLGPYKMDTVLGLIEKFEANGDVPLRDYRVLETDPTGFQRDVTKEFSAMTRLGKGVTDEDLDEGHPETISNKAPANDYDAHDNSGVEIDFDADADGEIVGQPDEDDK